MWAWNGMGQDWGGANAIIHLGGDGLGGGNDTLDYTTVGPSGTAFAGIQYSLHLEGNAILTPVPEAGTWGMMITGLGLVGAMAMRRK